VRAQQMPERFGSIDPDQLVRVRTRQHGLHVGRLAGVTSDSLLLRPQRGSSAVEIAAISELWVRGTATREGAMIGGAVGGVLGAAFLSWFSVAMCDAAECSVEGTATAVGLFGGAVVGAISGAVLGAMSGKWHRRFP
jgi:hypothetical protein